VVRPELSERDAAILTFEARWPTHTGAKDKAIKDDFEVSTARYYQLLNVVIDSPAAVRLEPMLVRRLQRARDDRTNARNLRVFVGANGGSPRQPTLNQPTLNESTE
jgi:Protein of unknown function (DUF3263)